MIKKTHHTAHIIHGFTSRVNTHVGYYPILLYILFMVLLVAFSAPVQGQCDTKVSGVFTYCNSFNNGTPVVGYFVGFRIADPTGDTLDVIDLDGGAIMNRGKRVALVGDLEPPNISTNPVRISGSGGDTTEYWYFGPYANGSSFNIALVDPNGDCDTVFVASGTYDCADNTGISDPSACGPPSGGDPPVPLYFLDFSNTEFDVYYGPYDDPVDNRFYIMSRTREQTCCDVGGNNIRCMELIVRLTENDFGLGIDDEGSGSTAGKLYADSLNGFTCTGNNNLTYPFQQGGGESNDSPLCFTGIEARDFIVLSCKAGGNATYLTVGTLSGVISTSSALTQENCSVGLNVYNASSAIWTSPDDPNLDNLQSCQSDSVFCSFLYNNDVFGPLTNCADTFTYIIGGYPLVDNCLPLDTILYDTTQVIVFPEFDVDINMVCTMDPDSVTLIANIIPALPNCDYIFNWSDGSTGSSITVLASNTSYSVTVTRADPKFAAAICSPATASVIANPDYIPSLPNDTICAGQTTTFELVNPLSGATAYSWNFGSGATPDTATGMGPHIVQYELTPENQDNGAYVTLTISRDGCTDVTDTVSTVLLNSSLPADISVNTEPTCYYTNKIFQPVDTLVPGATYVWNFGAGAVPATASGYGPHSVYYTAAGTKTVSLVVYPNQAGAQCPDSTTVSFNILGCPAQVLGYVKSNDGAPIQNVILKLYADANLDGAADNTVAIRTVSSSASGIYAMASIVPGHYVIVQTQPSGWVTTDDFDASIDNDVVDNISGLDNLIPATLAASEIDSMNNYIEAGQPASIMGYAFADDDVDNFPDEGEGIDSVEIRLLADTNADGTADTNIAVDSALTAADGSFHFDSVATGNYVIVEINREEYLSLLDVDASNDGDAVPNVNMNNDTIPVTIFNGEQDAQNFFMDGLICPLMVTNNQDEGYGSLRYNLECSQPGDTIRFHSVMAGDIIHLSTSHFSIDKDLHIRSSISPRITIASNVLKLFEVVPGVYVEFSNLDLISGDGSSEGAALDNFGEVRLENISIIKNPNFPQVQYLIRNHPGAILDVNGDCILDY